METLTVVVKGIPELDAALMEKLPNQVRSIIRSVLVEAGEWMAGQLSGAAPRSPSDKPHPSGYLAGSMRERMSIDIDADSAGVYVGPNADAFYDYFVETGHRIVKGGYSKLTRAGARGPGHEIGKAEPHQYMATVFDTTHSQWQEIVERGLRERLGLNV